MTIKLKASSGKLAAMLQTNRTKTKENKKTQLAAEFVEEMWRFFFFFSVETWKMRRSDSRRC